MTRLSRPTLRALRSVVARALGVRRSRVRVVEDVYPYPPGDSREVKVRFVTTGREPGRDWWSAVYVPSPRGRRWAVRYVARRARANDLP
jgi:hypothetical protein